VRSLLTVVACVAAGVLGLAAQRPPAPPVDPQATFRSGTDLVQVDIAVLDGKRNPVRGLTQGDFTVLEDGKPRPIAAFAEVHLPDRVAPAAAWMRDTPPDVSSNQVPEEGRIVVIVFDRTIPIGQPGMAARKAAIAAVNQLGPGDLAAITTTGAGMKQNLTSDRARLLRAIDKSGIGANPSDEAEEIASGLAAGVGLPPLSGLQDGRCYCGLCVPETITNIATAMGELPRRRKVVLFIGRDFVIQSADSDCGHRLKEAREKMFAALDRSSVTIHSIDPSGLESLLASASMRAPMRGPQMGNLERQGNLNILPSRTGGRTYANGNAPEESVPAIFRESDGYYLIGFPPAAPAPGAQPFHRIEVKVNRRGLTVVTRRGFSTPAPATPVPPADDTAPPALTSAIERLMPDADLPLTMSAAPFASPDGKGATLAIVVGAVLPAMPPTATPPSARHVDLVSRVYDQQGRSLGGARQNVDLTVDWPQAALSPRRLEALSKVDVRPGDHELRVALGTDSPERTGSVFAQVSVPNFANAPLALSGVLLSLPMHGLVVPPDLLSALVPVIPTSRRSFDTAERVRAFVRVYQGTTRNDLLAGVSLRTRVIDVSNRDRATLTEAIPATDFASNRSADELIDVPMRGLPPGEYLLQIDASARTLTATRALRFRVQ